MDKKTCSKCKVEKDANLEDFPPHKRLKDGLNTHCRECQRKAHSKWLAKNKDRHKENTLKWNKANKDKLTEIQYKYDTKWGSGVYGIFADGECLYVGESSKLTARIARHKAHIKNPSSAGHLENFYNELQGHETLVIGILEQCDNHVEREKYYIDMFNPIYNTYKLQSYV